MAKNRKPEPESTMKPSSDLNKSIIHMPESEHYTPDRGVEKDDDLTTRLDTIGLIISKTRSDAITGRKDTGIEDEWLEDEEYYEGIDDANRGELKAWRGKPLGAQYASSGDDVEGSTIFLNITRPYVDGVAARLGDILLPTDDVPFSIKPTPNPDMIKIAEGKIPEKIKQQIADELGKTQAQAPEQAQAQPMQTGAEQIPPELQAQLEAEQMQPGAEQAQLEAEQMQPGAEQAQEPMTPEQQQAERQATAEQSIIEQAKQVVKEVKRASTKAEKQIWDWCVESEYHTHNRRVIEDASKVGTGVLKGPVPIKTRNVIYKGGKLITVEKIKPGSVRVAYRNFFPDPACGENIHKGNYTWERDEISRSELMKLTRVPGYIDSQIKQVISEGPFSAVKEYNADADMPGLKQSHYAKNNMFEIWYYYGSMKREDLEVIHKAAKRFNLDEYDDDNGYFHVKLTMVNNRVIRTVISHLADGEFPYDVMTWQRRVNLPWGIGVSRQIRPAQRIVVGALRHMMDNAGVAGGPMLFIDTNLVQAADGVNEIKAWKIFVGADDYDPAKHHIGNGIQYITTPMLQAELQKIIELGLKMAEETTGMALIMQGQTNRETPNTLGGMIIQNNNASTVLRRVARLYDDGVTKPHIKRYYKHLMQYGSDDSMKGDFEIQALGSSSFIEREIANQAIFELGQYVGDPQFKKDPIKWMDEILRVSKIDPARLEYDDDKWQEIVENMAAQGEPQPDPKLEIAQLNIEANKALADSKNELFKIKGDADRASRERIVQMNLQSKAEDRAAMMQLGQMKIQLEQFIAQAQEQGLNTRELEKAKTKIQDTLSKLKVQFELSDREVIEPSAEPAGRAPEGDSFSQ